MKLKELCVLDVACCHKGTTVAEAARLMREHHTGDLVRRRPGGLQDVLQRGGDTAGDVDRGGCLDLADDRRAIHQHGVRVGSADVNPDSQTHARSPFSRFDFTRRIIRPATTGANLYSGAQGDCVAVEAP